MTDGQARRRYSEKFKEEAVELAEHGNVAETARRLGINRSMLDRWRRERSSDGEELRQREPLDERALELRRLQAENRRLREERTVLKKATVYSMGRRNSDL